MVDLRGESESDSDSESLRRDEEPARPVRATGANATSNRTIQCRAVACFPAATLHPNDSDFVPTLRTALGLLMPVKSLSRSCDYCVSQISTMGLHWQRIIICEVLLHQISRIDFIKESNGTMVVVMSLLTTEEVADVLECVDFWRRAVNVL